ncbi:response regulator [Candidatus Woesearchaeota archaeon]|nr:response regulator [Candidatus Woesearchaeota archaeon]
MFYDARKTGSGLSEKLVSSGTKGIALVVDDEGCSATAMKLLLTREGYESIVYGNFTDAARYIDREGRKRDSRVVMAFVDFQLPDGDGSEIIKMVKETLDIPVISISGLAYAQQHFSDPMKKADLISPKPIMPATLRKVIKDAEIIYKDRFEVDKAA